MPFYANTPESLVSRSDSKNPATTCRGITAGGRPCRRPLAADGSPIPPTRKKPGNLRVDDPSDESLYCWQHKEQASLSAKSSPGPKTTHTPILEERTSIDTLADRLGLIAPKKQGKSSKQNGAGTKPQQRPTKMARPKPKQELQLCCCFSVPIEEVTPPARPKPHPIQPTVSTPPPKNSGKRPSNQYLTPSPSPSPSRPGQSSGRRHSSSASQTVQYMTLIPPNASPQTASLLLAELAKPVSQQDEAGYIYIFWLTPESQPVTPAAEAARSLLSPSTPSRSSNGRRPSDVLDAFGSIPEGTGTRGPGGFGGSKKILLKIGRATNVQRRLNEWQRQCGYNLSLIRFYPYIPTGSPVAAPRKIPHSHKVERLVHIELAGRGLRVADREKCATCGREHREWFEVGASRKAVAEVDEVVRRWSDWNEAQA
ncbi:meiotically up-regulated gene 113-domain-containing protein [Echria macrotheca]|uniref:Meiotically up-regulated gene 113-domain-containing protein n=1 Tax=Echria macrotheca TaxID=438768 RepID=A0AAJ0B7T4_9PEZI|nr:meiotically up-regulated gene 113-domain-containing protein [Echria macrotheca]